jgi:hypothetical protein
MSMSNSFIFFGCWNNINCDKEAIYRDVVLNCIKQFEPDINNMFIAGDNWYNTLIKNKENKEESYKYYLVDTLVSGYHILYSMNKNTYICVGNHDEVEDNDANKNPKCMIKTQKYYINKLKKYIDDKTRDLGIVRTSQHEDAMLLRGTDTDTDYAEKTIKEFLNETLPSIEDLDDTDATNNVIKLYADKNIGVYENDSAPYIPYIVIIINTNILSEDYLDTVSKKIEGAKTKNANKKIFVMGHIPLFYDKHKKDKSAKAAKEKEKEGTGTEKVKEEIEEDITKLKKGVFGESSVLIDKLYDILAEHNCIYLCADCHNFNIMKIKKGNKSVIQITSGTGGADPDIIKDLKQKKEVQLSDYDISYYSINSYGYCNITVEPGSGGSVIVSYKKIIAADCNNKSIDELYVYNIKDNDIEYDRSALTEKEKIKEVILGKAKNNKEFYCGRVAQYSRADNKEGREKNVIKSSNPEKTVCYIKKGK